MTLDFESSASMPWVSQDLLEGSPSFRISEEATPQINKFRDALEAIPGFDPSVKFDPKIHLIQAKDVHTHNLSELNITNTHVPSISDIASTDPFPLFTPEAVAIMKWEAFRPEALRDYGRKSGKAVEVAPTDFQICGYIHQAPFTKAAWTHPETIAIISKLAGVELKFMFDYEICHINANLVDESRPVGEMVRSKDSAASVYDWHFDSNSFVVVLMLSAPEDMMGGSTGLEDGNGNVLYVEGPREGYATVLQGRVVRHIATKPLTNHERISAVGGYVPVSAAVPDTTVFTSFKPLVMPRSNHDEYYREWCEYRFDRLEKMVQLGQKRLAAGEYGGRLARDGAAGDSGRHFDQKAVVEWCEEMKDFLESTYNEFEYYEWRERGGASGASE